MKNQPFEGCLYTRQQKGVRRPLIFGSSRISGERLSDFQKEVFGIPVAIAHSLQQFDFVVHPL
ncbi:hypothetical protein AYI77_21175 [Shewanella algae]|nr:hypothetical protein AYI77_21175 [Shewanella algae]